MSEPLHILSLGAGVQSSTLALMAAAGEVTPMPHCAIFADTQAEPASVYRWLDWLEKQLPFPVHRVTAGDLAKRVTTPIPRMDGSGHYCQSVIPAYVESGIMPRQCTYDFKVEVLIKATRRLAEIPRGCKEVRAIQWIGISLDEVRRMKPSRVASISHRWPLVETKRSRWDCLRWMEARGFPAPPRSACVFCPFHGNAEWRRLRDEEPEEFAKAVSFEKLFQASRAKAGLKQVPYLHPSRVPLDQVDLSTDLERGQGDLFGGECEGMCGV